mgnify:CR=1 FL=1
MGAHKAFLFARTGWNMYCTPDLPDAGVARCLLNKGDAQTTMNDRFRQTQAAIRAILPYGKTTFFRTRD